MAANVYIGNITIRNYKSTGEWTRSKGNAQLILKPTQDVLIDSCEFGMKGYNCIEIGLAAGYAPKKVTVRNCHFKGVLSNNAILIFRHQANAVINIENCTFDEVSNVLRISNALNVSGCTVNFINCVCKQWECRPNYPNNAGYLICEDYTSKSPEVEAANNLYAPEKLTVNFINCYGPYGLIKATDTNIIGSKTPQQIAYVENDYGGFIDYTEENLGRYPVINITPNA